MNGITKLRTFLYPIYDGSHQMNDGSLEDRLTQNECSSKDIADLFKI